MAPWDIKNPASGSSTPSSSPSPPTSDFVLLSVDELYYTSETTTARYREGLQTGQISYKDYDDYMTHFNMGPPLASSSQLGEFKSLFSLPEMNITEVEKAIKAKEHLRILQNLVYMSLSRSQEELIHEITRKSGHTKEELINFESSGWYAYKTINWTSYSDYTKCLEREYRFIMKLLKHFDPASGNTKPFDYQPRRLLVKSTKSENVSTVRNLFNRMFGHSPANPLGVADEFYVWYCLLDDALAHVLPDTANKLAIFQPVLQNYVHLICNADIDQMETIRVITHNTLRFIVEMVPYLDPEKVNSSEDEQILKLQLDAVNRLVTNSESANRFQDLVNVFNSYWKKRNTLIENIVSKQSIPEQMKQIKTKLLTIVRVALQKNVSAGLMVNIFRAFNNLLIELDNVSFDWFIKPVAKFKMNRMIEMKIVEPVETKRNSSDIATYRVIDPKTFSTLIYVMIDDGEVGPRHYIVEIITKLLEYIIYQLQRSHWTSGIELTDHEQIASATVLITAVRSSLLYLEEQAGFASYDPFMCKSLQPFSSVVENSESLGDITKRIGLIMESFCLFRTQYGTE